MKIPTLQLLIAAITIQCAVLEVQSKQKHLKAPLSAQKIILIAPLLYYKPFFDFDVLLAPTKKPENALSLKSINISGNSIALNGKTVTVNGLGFTVTKETIVPAKNGYFLFTPTKSGISFKFNPQ